MPRLSLKMCIIYLLDINCKHDHFSDEIEKICMEIANIFLPGWILKVIIKAMIVASPTQLGSHKVMIVALLYALNWEAMIVASCT